MAQMLSRKAPIDAKIANQPIPDEGSGLFWHAFWQLCTCRRGTAPIAWTDVHLWATAHRLDPVLESELLSVVRELDVVMLAHMEKVRAAAEAAERATRDNNGQRQR